MGHRLPTLVGRRHGLEEVDGRESESLPFDRVYVVPRTGEILDGRNGHTYGDLTGTEVVLPRSTWFGRDTSLEERLWAEATEIVETAKACAWLGTFRLGEDTQHPRSSWERYDWSGYFPDGRSVVARYPGAYPDRWIDIRENPPVTTHHRRGPFLCYCKDEEWTPDWTIVTALLHAWTLVSQE